MERTFKLVRLMAALLGVAIMLAGPRGSVAATKPFPPIFGTKETRSNNLAAMTKWRGVLDRYLAEAKGAGASCESSWFSRCHLKDWKAFLDGLGGAGRMVQLDEINRFINRTRYLTDPRNYNVPDYWATPRQLFDRKGDCEDYAIAKFLSLRALGWDNDAMRVVVVQDLNLKVAHAVLVVDVGNTAWVLDNQLKRLIAADRVHHYKPFYSVNESAWWLHR